jgi:hypothetical protein
MPEGWKEGRQEDREARTEHRNAGRKEEMPRDGGGHFPLTPIFHATHILKMTVEDPTPTPAETLIGALKKGDQAAVKALLADGKVGYADIFEGALKNKDMTLFRACLKSGDVDVNKPAIVCDRRGFLMFLPLVGRPLPHFVLVLFSCSSMGCRLLFMLHTATVKCFFRFC